MSDAERAAGEERRPQLANSEKENKIFRDKSMEQLSTPEQLTGYLHVTGPGVWFVLGGLIILLSGLLVWGIFGRLVSTITVPAKAENSKVSCYILKDDIELPDEEISIIIGDVEMKADPAKAEEITLDASYDPELYSTGYLSAGKNVIILHCETTLQDGFYNAEVVTDELKPISLLFSK